MKLLTRSEMGDINPLDLMIRVVGERKIPLEVAVIVVVGIVLCGIIIHIKPWSKRYSTFTHSKVDSLRQHSIKMPSAFLTFDKRQVILLEVLPKAPSRFQFHQLETLRALQIQNLNCCLAQADLMHVDFISRHPKCVSAGTA